MIPTSSQASESPHTYALTQPKPSSGAQLVVAELLRRNVPWVVGIPGGAILPLYDALAQSPIPHVLARHEQAAGFIAQGAARVRGRAFVCLGTSGPGATNLLTAVADAKADSVPIVIITAQVPRALIGTDAFQEVDTCALARPITKACFQAQSAAELAELLPRAFDAAEGGRPGPVWLDIPKDVLNETTIEHSSHRPATSVRRPNQRSSPLDRQPMTALTATWLEAVSLAAQWLQQSKRPLLYVGGGIHLARAQAELAQLVNRFDLPVVASLQGLGALNATDRHWFGMLGMHGAPYTNMATEEADLVLALGVRFDDRATGNPQAFCRNARVIHVDVDPREIGKLRHADLGIVADLKVALQELLPLLQARKHEAWLSELDNLRQNEALVCSGEAMEVIAALNKALPTRCIVTTDVGQHQMWVAQQCEFSADRQLLTSGGLGTMGFGLPAAIGAALAAPDRRVVCVTGDGSFLMNIQELAVLAELQSDVCIVLLNNAQLGMVRQQQQLFYGQRFCASRFARNPDFAGVARGFGVQATRLSAADFCAQAQELMAQPGPQLLDVSVCEEDVLPMVPPGRSNLEMIRAIPRAYART